MVDWYGRGACVYWTEVVIRGWCPLPPQFFEPLLAIHFSVLPHCKVVPVYSPYRYPQVYLDPACRLGGGECSVQRSIEYVRPNYGCTQVDSGKLSTPPILCQPRDYRLLQWMFYFRISSLSKTVHPAFFDIVTLSRASR